MGICSAMRSRSNSYRSAKNCLLTFVTSTAFASSFVSARKSSNLCTTTPSSCTSILSTHPETRKPTQSIRPMSCAGAQPVNTDDIYGGGKGITVKSAVTSTAAIIFLHGLGDSGSGWASAFPLPNLPHCTTVLPNAKLNAVSLSGGMKMPSWFDLYGLDENSRDDEQGIIRATERIDRMIDALGIPSERIILAGFSQGGALALTAGLRNKRKLAGIIALSTWLPMRNQYPEKLSEHATQIPIFAAHGEDDEVVPMKFGKMSADLLSNIGFSVTFRSYPGMAHSASIQELEDMGKFIQQILS